MYLFFIYTFHRVLSKQARQKEQMLAAKKHQDAMKEMHKRKMENSSRKLANDKRANRLVSKGAASGMKTKNRFVCNLLFVHFLFVEI